MCSRSGAKLGFVNEFVGRGHVLEGIFGAQKRPIDVGGLASRNSRRVIFVGALAYGGQGLQGRLLPLDSVSGIWGQRA